ncbi:MAG: protein BatD, partial [Haliscomenobacter sp.]|nr:protein BatD [Haliscomenobacter sp.]
MQPKILPALFFFLLGLSTAVAAQRRVAQFEAFTDTEELFLDSYLELNLVLRNGEGTDFSPPDLKDFRILSGPSRGVSTTVINGQVDMEMRFSYTLQPRRLGKLQIGAASIKVNNRTLRTRPISISVIQGNKQKKGAGAGEEYFVRAELNKSQAYVGEQVRLDYKLYTRVEIQNYNMIEESGYLDFYAEDFQRIDGQVRKETLSGREYYTRVLKSLALYPQKAGVLRIEPASLQLGILVGDPSESFFFGGDVRRAAVLTEAVELRVAPVPGNPPVSFSGAVGDFSMNALLNRNTATTDDMLTLQMAVVGDGDLKRIEAPVLAVGDSFEVYEARVMEEVYSEEVNRRVGRKVFEYLLTPKVSGTYSLRPQFSYFSPAQNQFVTLSGQVFDLTIRPGSRKSPFDPGSLPGKTGQALQPLKQVQTLKKGGKPLLEQPLFLTFLFLPFFLAG